MRISKTGIEAVDDLYGVNFTGNVIPHTWYSAIKTEAGKPDLTAIVILAEILYWHRPREECDDSDHENIRLLKRFKADMLQLSYQQLSNKFGFSKDQSRRAMEHLEKLGIIKRHFRTIETASGSKLGNVMYVELFSDRLIELTYPGETSDPYRKNPTRVSDKTDEVIGKNRPPVAKNPMTNKENTTETTNTDYNSVYQAEISRVKEQIDYEALIRDMRSDRGMIDEIAGIIAEYILYGTEPQSINGERIPASLIREKLRKINSNMVAEVIDRLRSAPRNIANIRGYVLAALFNAASTYELGLDVEITRDMYRRDTSAWEA